jgi:NAD(P)H-dependent FMN reductase
MIIGMYIAIVIGSHRQASNSAKVSSIVSEILLQQNPDLQISIIDLGKNPLPIWDEKVWENTPEWTTTLKPYRDVLNQTDGLVIITPEYCGMASPALKNFFLFWTGDVVAHKPAMLIGVSTTDHGGSYPMSELRSSSYKNSRILYVPDQVTIRKADALPDQVSEFREEGHMRTLSRLQHGTKILLAYTKALQPMREQTDFQFKEFGNGM